MPSRAFYPDLAAASVFVTGGGSGIGAALTRAFAAQTARVAFVDIAEEESRALVDAVAAETGVAPLFIPCDIRDVPALQAAVRRAGEVHGDVGVLLNNAANDQRHRVEDVTRAYWDDRMAINQRPMMFAAQAVLPMMKRLGGGSIVNFGSISWKLGNGGMPAYTMAKAAVHGLTRGLARDFGPFGIRVNTLLPGWVMTERQKALWLTPEAEAEMLKGQCLKIRIEPDQVADLALFLASEASSACTAQEFTVDAGWS
ncbi:SDR family NAD(P)-dependent oxidoreductase [Chthonobacter rhizosphaerae]|uniref:SDR family NAD(P)-dependent oxidoreductase n=1 Tax=Chthonobacter rhizosphaerae TaxID=2735553 RepID=UPI0015EE8D70|nr:SDR family oxidoreductase [Chthonobacter rhizosphaerae]